MKKILLLSLAAGYMTAANAQKIEQKEVARIIQTLAADDMQGRSPGTPGIEKAAAFISSEFKKAGIKPLPGEKDFQQHFIKYGLQPVSQQLVINGESKDWPVVPVGTSTHIRIKNDTSTTIVHVKDPGQMMKLLRDKNPRQKDLVIWLDPSMAGYLDGISHSFSGRFYNTPEEIIAKEAAHQVVLIYEKDPVPDTASWSLEVTREVKSRDYANVAGMIKGSTKPDEYVVFSGHYDHLGVLPAVAGDSIANGADDDASGTTAVITLASYFSKKRPARSIIFVAFTAEESGGYGSSYFSEKLDPAKVVAMFNIEMIGKESKFGKNSAFITGFDKSDFGTILQRSLEGSAFHFYPDPYPEQDLFYRSDNATLARLGVPAHTISTTQIDKDTFYHTVDDELATLDVTNITDIIKAIATSSTSIVNGTATPTRIAPLPAR
ncbi:M20/M25/M40 family metallo-hydrolase [Chitinophaga solisilvae]|uniref:M20/M25/M40 family metallo-hydrolase n=1 Tax=Chitinophaga solisilvae TaxID=1233460 RepID=A0A3S1CXI3_9BACT|nr:M20/M25/M40 family metallo-hydrolase [Chitinophaga solisilvae]NSL89954.1 M20/M25/M40 family metallo-hydrolase [Chitinophaga solisilvae]